MAAKITTIDDYLAALSDDKRATLEKLRKIIRAAAPSAEECFSYGLPAFCLNGRPLVAFSASANHCSFFPMNGTTVAAFKADLKNYDTSKGTIRFPVDKALPVALVRKLVKARIAENAVRSGKAAKSRAAGGSQTDPAVAAFLGDMKHPLKKEIATIRQIIHGVSPKIAEGIKWNSPSFRTTEWFATLNLREGRVWLILHSGAKVKDNSTKGLKIADPGRVLKWLSQDRALVTFDDAKDLQAKRAALVSIVREWIKYV